MALRARRARLADLLAAHARARPDHAALIADGRLCTWAALHDEVRGTAARLRDLGVASGDVVGLLLPNGSGLVRALAALWELGAVAFPLLVDSTAPEITRDLVAVECGRVLAADHLAGRCADWLSGGSGRRVHTMSELGASELAAGRVARGSDGDRERMDREPTVDDRGAVVLSTSGTTGTRGFVLRTHAQLACLAEIYGRAVAASAEDHILTTVPIAHGHGLCSGLLASFYAGATLELAERFAPHSVWNRLQEPGVTILVGVPFVFAILSETRLAAPLRPTSLRACISGGADLPLDVWRRTRARFGVPVRQSYGSAETGALTFDRDGESESDFGSVGTPLEGVEVEIRDSTGRAAPAGVVGEIVVRSPAASAVVWTEAGGRGRELGKPNDGWWATGDLGRLDEVGRLFLCGRRSSVINVAGRKVLPEEVEAVLRSHPAVVDALVLATRDRYGEQAVRALVVVRGERDREELLAHCRGRLAGFKVPRVVEFREHLPRTAAGKLRRLEHDGEV
jgi:long-chain acyl-CoA synthetase